MSDVLQNSTDYIDKLVERYSISPAAAESLREDLYRLVQRVSMDTRNMISSAYSDLEIEINAAARSKKLG
jgi:hypothetical protein